MLQSTHSTVVDSSRSDKTFGLLCVQNIHVHFGALQTLLFTHALSAAHGLLLFLFRNASIVCSRVVVDGFLCGLFGGDGLVKVDSW